MPKYSSGQIRHQMNVARMRARSEARRFEREMDRAARRFEQDVKREIDRIERDLRRR